MTEQQVDEAMRLASMLATARCQRMLANARDKGQHAIDQAEKLVVKRTEELRNYLKSLP